MYINLNMKNGNNDIDWFEYPTPVREGSIPARVKKTIYRIFDGFHDYSIHDMSDLKRDSKKSDGRIVGLL